MAGTGALGKRWRELPKKMKAWVLLLVLVAGWLLYGLWTQLLFPKRIAAVYIWHSSMGIRSPEYKVDLENGLLWEYHASPYDPGGYIPRNGMAENEGFSTVSPLVPEKAEKFWRNSMAHGLGRWKKEYQDPYVMDGHHWKVIVCFADGTQRNTYGSNAYPLSWGSIRRDLVELTGKDLLE